MPQATKQLLSHWTVCGEHSIQIGIGTSWTTATETIRHNGRCWWSQWRWGWGTSAFTWFKRRRNSFSGRRGWCWCRIYIGKYMLLRRQLMPINEETKKRINSTPSNEWNGLINFFFRVRILTCKMNEQHFDPKVLKISMKQKKCDDRKSLFSERKNKERNELRKHKKLWWKSTFLIDETGEDGSGRMRVRHGLIKMNT